MKFSRFVTNPQDTSTHSSGLAGNGAPKPQSFAEREQLERNRRIVKAYQQSLLGAANQERGKVVSSPRPINQPIHSSRSRQQFNVSISSQSRFKEPPARGFNPYA